MMYRSEYDKTGRASRRGAEAEIAFKKAMDSFFGSNIEYTDENNGQFDHIDFRCSLGMTVDVKSIKDPETIWIEIKNIKGYDGWLYGDCTHFAFERESFFQLVKKFDLINLVDDLVDRECMVDSPKDCMYKMYSRKKFGRDDLLTKIDPQDLYKIPYIKIKKNTESDVDLNPFL